MNKEFWKYQKLLWKTAYQSFLEHFEGIKKLSEPLIASGFTILCSVIALLIFNGAIGVNDLWIIAISTIGGPVVYIAVIFLIKRITASYDLFTGREVEFKKELQKKNLNCKNIVGKMLIFG